MELTGKIIAVLPANSGVSNRTGNPWMSQEFVIEVPGQYPRKCVFRVFEISPYSLILMLMNTMAVGLMKSAPIM